MNYPEFNTARAKGKHLTHEERVSIQIHLKDGWRAYRMAKEIGCAANTVRNEIKRGKVLLYHETISAIRPAQVKLCTGTPPAQQEKLLSLSQA